MLIAWVCHKSHHTCILLLKAQAEYFLTNDFFPQFRQLRFCSDLHLAKTYLKWNCHSSLDLISACIFDKQSSILEPFNTRLMPRKSAWSSGGACSRTTSPLTGAVIQRWQHCYSVNVIGCKRERNSPQFLWFLAAFLRWVISSCSREEGGQSSRMPLLLARLLYPSRTSRLFSQESEIKEPWCSRQSTGFGHGLGRKAYLLFAKIGIIRVINIFRLEGTPGDHVVQPLKQG